MASLHDLVQQGHSRVRRPEWHARAYLQLQVIEHGGRRGYGPWARIYDVTEAEPTEPVFVLTMEKDGWEAYEGEEIRFGDALYRGDRNAQLG